VAFMLVDTRSWYFSANSPITARYGALLTGQPRLPRGVLQQTRGQLRGTEVRMAMDCVMRMFTIT
jgi:hypothetical protein